MYTCPSYPRTVKILHEAGSEVKVLRAPPPLHQLLRPLGVQSGVPQALRPLQQQVTEEVLRALHLGGLGTLDRHGVGQEGAGGSCRGGREAQPSFFFLLCLLPPSLSSLHLSLPSSLTPSIPSYPPSLSPSLSSLRLSLSPSLHLLFSPSLPHLG